MKFNFATSLIIAFILLQLQINAQIKKDPANSKQDPVSAATGTHDMLTDSISVKPKKNHFEIGLSYLTDNIYLGRKDSVRLPYLGPKIGYYDKSGFFAEVEAGFNTSSTNGGLDLITLASGYSFTAGNYEGQFTASKFFYSSKSSNIKSETRGSIEYNNAYDLGFIKPSLQADVNFGPQTDYATTLGLEHSFYADHEKFEITPTVVSNASTQNYYSNYYKVRKYNPKRKTAPLPTGIASISGEVVGASSLKVLDYELQLPIHFETGKCTFGFIPTYALPVHPAELLITTKLNNGTTISKTSTEQLSNRFFGTLEMYIKL